jgi:hypothetical protein
MLLNAGVSRVTVLDKMKADGLDGSLLPVSVSAATSESSETDLVATKEEERAATVNHVSPDGDNPFGCDVDEFSDPPSGNLSPPTTTTYSSIPIPISSPPLPPSPMAKYELMVSIGISPQVVRKKMESEGMSTVTVAKFIEEKYPAVIEEDETSVIALNNKDDPIAENDLHQMIHSKQNESLQSDLKHLDDLIQHAEQEEQKKLSNKEFGENKTEPEKGPQRTLDKCLTAENPEAQHIEVDEWGRLPGPPQLMIMNSFTCPVCLAEGKLEVSFPGQDSLIAHYDSTHKELSPPQAYQHRQSSLDSSSHSNKSSDSWMTMFNGLSSHSQSGAKYQFTSSSDDALASGEPAAAAATPLDVLVEQIVGDSKTSEDNTPMDWVLQALGLSGPQLPKVTSFSNSSTLS